MNSPVFEVYSSRHEFENGPAGATFSDVRYEYRWRLKGENGEIVASSEAYTRKTDAIRGAETAKRLMETAEIVDGD